MKPKCTFDEVLPKAVAAVRNFLDRNDSQKVRFVRDISGRMHVVLPDEISEPDLMTLRLELVEVLGAYNPGESFVAIRARDTLDGAALLSEPALIRYFNGLQIRLIERRGIGQDWVIQPTQQMSAIPRVVFFSMKGGVGRSTALLLWGRDLASRGKRVLLVDLDLEAPGLGSQLLERTELPSFGVLDWLVEDLTGNAGSNLAELMTAESRITSQPGLIVAPAIGSISEENSDEIIAKLARAYLEGLNYSSGLGYSARLGRMISSLEEKVKPDIVLIDSRAGLHETTASNLLHLNAEVLMFGVDLPVNWRAYSYLFGHLRLLAQSAKPEELSWRDRVKMVHARSDSPNEDDLAFIANSYALWTQFLYDEMAPGDVPGGKFSFDERDQSAPHWPIPILWSERLERFDPLKEVDKLDRPIREAFGRFFEELNERVGALDND